MTLTAQHRDAGLGFRRNTMGRGLGWWRYINLTQNTRHIVIDGESMVPPGGAGSVEGAIIVEGMWFGGSAAAALSALAFYIPTVPGPGAISSGTLIGPVWQGSSTIITEEHTIVDDDLTLVAPAGRMLVIDSAGFNTSASDALIWGRFEYGKGANTTLADLYTVV